MSTRTALHQSGIIRCQIEASTLALLRTLGGAKRTERLIMWLYTLHMIIAVGLCWTG